MTQPLIPEYTNVVLDFDFTGCDQAQSALTPMTEDASAFTERTLGMLEKSGKQTLVLFGIGSGVCPLALEKALPENVRLIVCETDTGAARTFLNANPTWKDTETPCSVVGDISLWAHLVLLAASGISGENAHTALNPELSETDRKQFQALQRIFLQARPHQAINSSYLSHVGVQAPDLSVGAILSPDEPNLDRYFAQFPDWVKEVVVIWDAEEVPETEYTCAAPIRSFAHPLEDFSDQRNRMLKECDGDWILYLDGDEMFSEDIWSLFTALMLIKRLEGCYFPRMTFYPDETACKVGYGLWPDLQLRLFRNSGNLSFERPVHEKLTGLQGRVGIALDAPILHYSRIRKNAEELTRKLARFDEASDGQVRHRLNTDYPHLDRTHFPEASFIMGALQTVLLEENPG